MKNMTAFFTNQPRFGDADPHAPFDDGINSNADPLDIPNNSAQIPGHAAADDPPAKPAAADDSAGKPAAPAAADDSAGKPADAATADADADAALRAAFGTDLQDDEIESRIGLLKQYGSFDPAAQAEILTDYARSAETVRLLTEEVNRIRSGGGDPAQKPQPKKDPDEKKPVTLDAALDRIQKLENDALTRAISEDNDRKSAVFEGALQAAVQADTDLADNPDALELVKALSDSTLLRAGSKRLPANPARFAEPLIEKVKAIIKRSNGAFVSRRAAQLAATLGEAGSPGALAPDPKEDALDMDDPEFEALLNSDGKTGLIQ